MALMRRNLVAGIAGLAALAYAASVVTSWRPSFVDWAHEVVPIIVPLLAAGVCFRAAVRGPRQARATWVLFGAGAVTWALGDIGFTVLDLFEIDPAGSLTAADIGYLALIPLWGAALVLHPARARARFELLGASLDAVTVFIAAAAVTTAFVLEPTLASSEDTAGAIVALAYPTGDLILLGAFMTVRARTASRLHLGEALIAGAIVVFVFGDIYFARLALTDAYNTGHPVDLSWVGAFVMLMVAARAGLRARARKEEEMASVPLLTVVGMASMASLAVVALVASEHSTVLLFGAVITGVLVAMRQATLLVERIRVMRSLNANVHALEEAQKARERFLATVSHDLRTPLTAIGGFAELMTDPRVAGDPKQLELYVESIKRNTRRLARLTEDLLAAGQFSSGHAPPLHSETIDLLATVKRAVADLGYGEQVHVDGEEVSVSADAQRLEQILGNLLDNAHKHSSAPSSVSVRVTATQEGAELEVSDRGKGIAPERMQAIFDPFVSDFASSSSAGLGLYVVRNLVAAMGGRVSVTSEVGRGSTFRVVLPTASAEMHDIASGRVA